MNEYKDTRKTISRLDLILGGGHHDLSRLINNYSWYRRGDYLKLQVWDVELEKDDHLQFTLPMFNHVFFYLKKASGKEYAMTLYPPTRAEFGANNFGEVILDTELHGHFDRGSFQIEFEIYRKLEKLPADLIQSFYLKDQSYGKVLKPKGAEGYRQEFPMELRTGIFGGRSYDGINWEKSWNIDTNHLSVGGQLEGFNREEFCGEIHKAAVLAVEAKLKELCNPSVQEALEDSDKEELMKDG